MAFLIAFVSCEKTNDIGGGGNDDGKTGELQLVPSSLAVEVGDDVTFKVEMDGNDVTSQASIVDADGNELEGATWKAQKEGSFTFTAIYNSVTSKSVTISVERFRRKVLVHKFTATWCGYCPAYTKVLDKLSEEMPDRITVIAVHGGDDFSILDGSTLESVAGVEGYPTAWVDCREKCSTNEAATKKAIEKSIFEFPAVCGISLETSVSDRDINVKANIEFAEDGEYKICAALIEDEIHFDGTCTEPTKTYHHVLRQYATEVMGDDLGAQKAGTIEKTFGFKAAKSWNMDNLKVVVYVMKKYGNTYSVNNVEVSPAGGSVPLD